MSNWNRTRLNLRNYKYWYPVIQKRTSSLFSYQYQWQPRTSGLLKTNQRHSADEKGWKANEGKANQCQPVSLCLSLAYRRMVLRISERRRAAAREFVQRNDLLQNTSLKKGTDTIRSRRFRNSPFQVFRLKKTRIANRKCSATGNWPEVSSSSDTLYLKM